MRVYIATTLTNKPAARIAADLLASHGHTNAFAWWNEPPATTPEQLAAIAVLEADGVRRSDVVLALMPGWRGTHVEIGMALAWGIPVIIVEERRHACNACHALGDLCSMHAKSAERDGPTAHNPKPPTPCAFHYLPEVRRVSSLTWAMGTIATIEGELPAGSRPWRP